MGEIEAHFGFCVADGGFVVLNVARYDDSFVQFLALALGGTRTAEAAATVAIRGGDGRRRLVDPATSEALLALGWLPPEVDPMRLAAPDGPSPNFHRGWPADHGWPPALFADLAVRTLHSVWRVEPESVQIRSAPLEAVEWPGRF